MENGKEPAFASPGTYNPNNGNHNGDQQFGLTKREYFAGLAMQGICASNGWKLSLDGIVNASVEIADKLLKELEKQQQNETD